MMKSVRSQFVRCAVEAQQRGLTLVISDQGITDTSYGLRAVNGDTAEWFATLDGVEGYLRGLAATDHLLQGGADA